VFWSQPVHRGCGNAFRMPHGYASVALYMPDWLDPCHFRAAGATTVNDLAACPTHRTLSDGNPVVLAQ
jgi:hypothetical protein